MKTVADKMGLRADMRGYLKNAPKDAVKSLALPKMKLSERLQGLFDYEHLFVIKQSEFTAAFSKMKTHLRPSGSLWVSWPKSGNLESDLNIKIVIKLGYDCGLVESKALSVNETWSALKFTFPKADKVYRNSYGKLPSQS